MSESRYHINETELQNVEKICVLCWGLLGDVFFRIPVIEGLKKRFPHARITVVVDPSSQVVLENHPDVGDIYCFSRNKKPLRAYLGNMIRSILLLRRRHFDMSVNLYSGGSSPTITRLIDARIRLGFDHTKALRKANNVLARHPHFCQHWTRSLAQVLEPLDINPETIRLGTSYYCKPDRPAEVIKRLNLTEKKYIVYNLGAGGKGKLWPVSHFVELAHRVHRQLGYTPVIIKNPGLEYLAEQFFDLYPLKDEMVKLSIMPFSEVAAIISKSLCIVTGDTSIMHLAFGLKVPSLVLFTWTRPEYVAPEDCKFIPIFKEDNHQLDSCGRPSGCADISVDDAYDGIENLIRDIADV